MRRTLIADSCVGGLSVIRAMQTIDADHELIFLADYAINPLGTKSETEINRVVDRWLRAAESHADELLIACNTLSIRYAQLMAGGTSTRERLSVTSMVDYFLAMIERESALLRDANVLVVGTQFTSSQSMFVDMLHEQTACAAIETFAATQLEQQIARFEEGDPFADQGFEEAVSRCDVVILACTCFPFAIDALQRRFPTKVFLDPARVHDSQQNTARPKPVVSIATTGSVVPPDRVIQFAERWLGDRYAIRHASIPGLQ